MYYNHMMVIEMLLDHMKYPMVLTIQNEEKQIDETYLFYSFHLNIPLVEDDHDKVTIVKVNLMHSFDVVDDEQHIVVAQQVLLSLKVAVAAYVVVIYVVDSSPVVVVVVVRMDDSNVYVLRVTQKKTVQSNDVVLLLIVENFERMTKYCSAWLLSL